MARARTAPTSSEQAETFPCPECGKTFTRAASLGAHRQRVHGVAGRSKARSKSKRSPRRANAGRRETSAQVAQPSSDGVNRDALLQMLFPNGVPAREDTIRRVTSWLDEAEQLAAVK
jgi:uncharacterized C2H2 Zn-finger protein